VTKSLQDTFAKDNLPPAEQFPEFSNLAEFDYPEKMNCVKNFLDDAVAEGFGERLVIITPEEEYTYAQLQKDANQLAHVL
jgi:2-aminobenzoate-CoA ligase